MNTYEVQLCYAKYVTFKVKAQDEEQAESQAWEELSKDADSFISWGDWSLDAIDKVRGDEQNGT